MGRDFKSTLSLATRQYDEYIKPVWPFMIRGYGIPVEGKTDDDLANKLDQLAGIDIFNIDGDVTYGVASRIQTGKAWNTFTVRKKRDSGTETEYAKRLKAINSDGILFPRVTYQAYVSADTGGTLLSMAVCLTKELISLCKNGYAKTRHTGRGQYGGAEFFVMEWSDMVQFGCKMRILHTDGKVVRYNMDPEPVVERVLRNTMSNISAMNQR